MYHTIFAATVWTNPNVQGSWHFTLSVRGDTSSHDFLFFSITGENSNRFFSDLLMSQINFDIDMNVHLELWIMPARCK